MEKAKPMRLAMPTVAAWIDELRAAFGKDAVDQAIRAGMDGQPTFHARENGQEVGTPIPYDENKVVPMSDIHLGPFNAVAAPLRKPGRP